MKLLILAYDFPPFISIGGLRPYSWYKYLSDYGIDVTVVTRNWQKDDATTNRADLQDIQNSNTAIVEQTDGKTLIKARFKPGVKDWIAEHLGLNNVPFLRKANTYLFGFLEFLSLRLDPKAAIYKEADKLLQKEKFDLIIATGKPFILFRYAALLSKKHKTPWVADYRDSWTLNHYQSDYSLDTLNFILNSFYKVMEHKYVSTASLITTVAPSYLAFMPPFFNRDNIKVVYNGYDNDIEKAVEGIMPLTNKFVISYAGHIYYMQNLEAFLEAVCIFLKENLLADDEFEIHFWGVKDDAAAVNRFMNYNPALNKYIHLHSKTGYVEVMKQISTSHILLLLTTNSDSWLNAKLFDYLVLKRPVLMMGKTTNIMSGILAETNGGLVAENAADAAAYISACFKTYKTSVPNKTINYEQYSRKNQAEKLSQILKNLIS